MNLSTIKRYHELGINVHPCCPPNHHCGSPGKIPFDPYNGQHMSGWQNHEPFSEELWGEWLDLEPDINLGMLCGDVSKLVLIDIDSDEGMEMFNDLAGRGDHGGWEYRTGRGLRVLYRAEGSTPSRKVSRGDTFLEILGDGRNSVLPPSTHPSGRPYEWTPGRTPRDREIIAEPKWLRDLSTRIEADVTSQPDDWGSIFHQGATEGSRDNTMTRIVGRLMAPAPLSQREVMAVALAINAANFQPPLAQGETKKIVKSISRKQGLSEESMRQEIWRCAKALGCSYEEATIIWEDGNA